VHFLRGGEDFIGVQTSGLPGRELKTCSESSGCSYNKSMAGFGGLDRGILCYLFCSAGSFMAARYPLGREKAASVIPASLREIPKIP